MAELRKSILEGPTGKVGPVIVYSQNGKTYMRAKPASYRDQKSEAQLNQRMKMKLITDFMKRFPKLFARTFIQDVAGRTSYHTAKSYNMRHGITGEYPDLKLNKAQLLISEGEITAPEDLQAKMEDGKIIITWSNTQKDNTNPSDFVLIAYTIGIESKYDFTNVLRRDGKIELKSSGTSPGKIDIWLAFYRPLTKEASCSVYCSVL